MPSASLCHQSLSPHLSYTSRASSHLHASLILLLNVLVTSALTNSCLLTGIVNRIRIVFALLTDVSPHGS
jgi:hypothetical protein